MSGGRRIRVIADEYVDREFGTGALKITPGALLARPGLPANHCSLDGASLHLTCCTRCSVCSCCHDVNDYEIGKRCGLEIINIMNNDGSLNAAAGAYAGMDRFEGEAWW